MRRPNRRPTYLKAEDIEDWTNAANFIISLDGADTVALNGSTGRELERNTDAATVIQAAIDARTYAERSFIFIKPGDYTITKQIDLKGRVEFRGAGIDVTRLSAADTSQDFNILSWLPTSNEYFLNIRDMTIEGDGTDGTSGHCIYFDDGSGGTTNDCHIDHVMTIHAVDDGIYAQNNWGFKLTNSIMEYSGRYNLSLGSVSQNYIAYCFIAYCKGLYAVKSNSPKMVFTNNVVYANEKTGMLLTGSVTNMLIANNIINGNGTAAASDGVWVDGSNHETMISNNQIYDNTDRGIDVDADDCIINGNLFNNNTNGPIADSGDRNIINGGVYETANAETPAGTYPIGTTITFVDSGDASGDGVYFVDTTGTIRKLT